MQDIRLQFEDLLLNTKYYFSLFWDNVVVDKIGLEAPPLFNGIPINSIDINWIKESPHSYYAYSPTYKGIYAVTNKPETLVDAVNDSIYSYFNVPSYYARKMGNTFRPPKEAWEALMKGKHNKIKTEISTPAFA